MNGIRKYLALLLAALLCLSVLTVGAWASEEAVEEVLVGEPTEEALEEFLLAEETLSTEKSPNEFPLPEETPEELPLMEVFDSEHLGEDAPPTSEGTEEESPVEASITDEFALDLIEPTTDGAGQTHEWDAAYEQAITGYVKQMGSGVVQLLDLDMDGTPELMLATPQNAAGSGYLDHVYTYRNGNLQELTISVNVPKRGTDDGLSGEMYNCTVTAYRNTQDGSYRWEAKFYTRSGIAHQYSYLGLLVLDGNTLTYQEVFETTSDNNPDNHKYWQNGKQLGSESAYNAAIDSWRSGWIEASDWESYATTFSSSSALSSQISSFLSLYQGRTDDLVSDAYSGTIYSYGEPYGVHIPKINVEGSESVNEYLWNELYPIAMGDGIGYGPDKFSMDYEWYSANDVVSILVTLSQVEYDNLDYIVFNIDTKDFHVLSDEEALRALGMSVEIFQSKLSGATEEWCYENMTIIPHDSPTYSERLSLTLAEDNLRNAHPYINTNGELSAIVLVYTFTGTGEGLFLIPLGSLDEFTPAPDPITFAPDGTTAAVSSAYRQYYARVALVLNNNGVSGLYITQAGIEDDGTVLIPSLGMPGMTVTAVNIALVPTLQDIQKTTPDVKASAFMNLT